MQTSRTVLSLFPAAFAVLLPAPVLLLPTIASALSLDQATRSVQVTTFIDSSEVFTDTDREGSERVAPGAFFEAAVGGTGFGDIVNATGESTQDSSIDVDSFGRLVVLGSGGAGGIVDVDDPGFPSRALALTDSRLAIVFTLDADRPFIVSTSLSAELSEASSFAPTARLDTEVRAFARLRGVQSGLVLEREVVDDRAGDGASVDDFTLEGVLTADTYVFELLALSDLRAYEDATGLGVAGFGVSFVVAPEPSTALMLGLGLALLPRRRTPTL